MLSQARVATSQGEGPKSWNCLQPQKALEKLEDRLGFFSICLKTERFGVLCAPKLHPVQLRKS